MTTPPAPPETPDEPEDDATIAVTRAAFSPPGQGEGPDTTLVVDRGGRRGKLTRPDAAHRRRGIKPPPVPEGFAPLPVEGLGPWGVEEYPARAITPPPAPAAADPDALPARGADPAIRSVRRHARRTARVAVVVFALSCVLAVAAIAVIALRLL